MRDEQPFPRNISLETVLAAAGNFEGFGRVAAVVEVSDWKGCLYNDVNEYCPISHFH